MGLRFVRQPHFLFYLPHWGTLSSLWGFSSCGCPSFRHIGRAFNTLLSDFCSKTQLCKRVALLPLSSPAPARFTEGWIFLHVPDTRNKDQHCAKACIEKPAQGIGS